MHVDCSSTLSGRQPGNSIEEQGDSSLSQSGAIEGHNIIGPGDFANLDWWSCLKRKSSLYQEQE